MKLLKDYIKKKDYDYINVRKIKCDDVMYQDINELFTNSVYIGSCHSEDGELILHEQNDRFKDYMSVVYAEEFSDIKKEIYSGLDIFCI